MKPIRYKTWNLIMTIFDRGVDVASGIVGVLLSESGPLAALVSFLIEIGGWAIKSILSIIPHEDRATSFAERSPALAKAVHEMGISFNEVLHKRALLLAKKHGIDIYNKNEIKKITMPFISENPFKEQMVAPLPPVYAKIYKKNEKIRPRIQHYPYQPHSIIGFEYFD